MSILDRFFSKNVGKTPTIIPTPESASGEAIASAAKKFSYGPGDQIMGRYDVVTIATGGMGVVYFCADQAQGQRPTALKTFKPQFLSSRKVRNKFLQEGTFWVGLDHPNIVRAYGVERIGDGREIYLVLEWVAAAEDKDDASLRAWLNRDAPLRVDQALLFSLHIARGMKYATAKIPGLIHRDLKPENVLIGRDGKARVTDFGLAKALADSDRGGLGTGPLGRDFKRTVVTQGLVGKPLYMAPEQWTKGAIVDARADIYAFGCMLYEMLTGKSAVLGDSLETLSQSHRFGLLREMPVDLPAEVKALIQRCMALEVADRCQSWEEVEASIMVIFERVAGEPAPPELVVSERNEKLSHADLIAAGWSYNAMGLSYYDIGNYDMAAGYFERVLWIGRQEKDQRLEATGLSHLGNACRSLSDLDNAIRYHKQQHRMARKIGAKAIEGDALGNLGNDFAELGDIQRAMTYFQQQLGIAKSIDDAYREGRALRNLADASRSLGNAERAINIYKHAMAIAKKNKDRVNEGRILQSIGLAYVLLDNVSKAMRFYEQALNIAKETGDRTGEGYALGAMGLARRLMDDTDHAVILLLQYLSITREVGLKVEEVRVLNNLGLIYLEDGDPAQALEYYKDCLVVARTTGNPALWASVLWSLGNCYRDLGKLDRAIGYYEGCISKAQEVQDNQSLNIVVSALYNLSNAYRHSGDRMRANSYYEKAFRAAKQAKDEASLANISVDYAISLSMEGYRERALFYAETALESFKKQRDRDGVKETRQIIAEIRQRKDRFQPHN